jgi:hypothetical protein
MFDPAHDLEWTGGLTDVRPRQAGPLVAGAEVEPTALAPDWKATRLGGQLNRG